MWLFLTQKTFGFWQQQLDICTVAKSELKQQKKNRWFLRRTKEVKLKQTHIQYLKNTKDPTSKGEISI